MLFGLTYFIIAIVLYSNTQKPERENEQQKKKEERRGIRLEYLTIIHIVTVCNTAIKTSLPFHYACWSVPSIWKYLHEIPVFGLLVPNLIENMYLLVHVHKGNIQSIHYRKQLGKYFCFLFQKTDRGVNISGEVLFAICLAIHLCLNRAYHVKLSDTKWYKWQITESKMCRRMLKRMAINQRQRY